MSANYLLAKVLYILNHDSSSFFLLGKMPVQCMPKYVLTVYDFPLLLPHLTFLY